MGNDSYTPRGIIGDHALQGMMGASSAIHAAHMASQILLNEQALGMLNELSLDSKVCGAVSTIKGLVEDIVMTERRVHRSNVSISSGYGESVHLSRKRVKAMKELDHLIHLTGSPRIAEFRQDVLKLLAALESRRERASQYVHGQLDRHVIIEHEHRVDALRHRVRDFVAVEFGDVKAPQPKVGILRRLFTRKEKDPAEWYLDWTGRAGPL